MPHQMFALAIGRWDAGAISQAPVPLLNSLSDMDERQFWGAVDPRGTSSLVARSQ